jgi:signal transduction histidine kinase
MTDIDASHGVHRAGGHRRTLALQALAVGVGILAPVILSVLLQQESTQARNVEAQALASRVAMITERTVARASSVALAAAAHVAAAGLPSPSAFRVFVAGLDLAPGVRAVAVAPLLDGRDVAAVQERLSKDPERVAAGYPPYEVWPLPTGEGLVCPTQLVEPQEGNRRVHGHEFCSDPARGEAVRTAVETGRPAMSRPVVLAQDSGRRTVSTLIVAPVSEAGGERPGRVRTVVAVGYTITAALEQALGTDSFREAGIRITDVDGAAGSTVLLDGSGMDPPGAFAEASVLGRHWRVEVARPRVSWADDPRPAVAAGLPLLGLALGLVAARELGRARKGRDDLERIVSTRTRELRRANVALAERNRLVEEASRAKTTFLANMSHELRTPLNAVIGFSEMMLVMDGRISEEKRREYLQAILDSGRHQLALVDEVLDLGRIEAGQLGLDLAEADLSALVAEVVRIVSPAAAEGRVTLSGPPEAPPVPLVVDRTRLKQALLNIVSNAVRFTPPDGSVTVSLHPSEDRVVARVSDTGSGMTPSELAKAVEPFWQAEGALARRHGGAGLGLPITRRIAEMHGGALRIRSEPGRGTTVEIELPRLRG